MDVVFRQEEQLTTLQSDYNQLKKNVEESNSVLASLLPGYAEAIGFKNDLVLMEESNIEDYQDHAITEDNLLHSDEDDVVYFEISKVQIEASLEMAREQYREIQDDAGQTKNLLLGNSKNSPNGNIPLGIDDFYQIPVKDHPFWPKTDYEPEYKEEIIVYVQSLFEDAMHTHKKYAHKCKGLYKLRTHSLKNRQLLS